MIKRCCARSRNVLHNGTQLAVVMRPTAYHAVIPNGEKNGKDGKGQQQKMKRNRE